MKLFRTVLSVAFVVIAVPAVLAAGQFDYLVNDLDALDDSLLLLDSEQEMLESEIDFQSDPEIFPDVDSDEVREALLEEQASTTHVYVYIDGEAVIFGDVPFEQWFAPYVKDVADRSIVSGYKSADGKPLGIFGPADNVTLEQLAKIAVESAEIDRSECPEEPKNPTAQGQWSAGYIACAESLLWSVYAEGSVDVQGLASRRDVVLTILQAFGRELEPSAVQTFTDVPKTMAFRDAIEMAYKDNIIEGYKDESGTLTGLFGPFDPVKRAEIAKIVSLSIQVYGF